MNLENKWIRSAIPALLLHCSIGTVYCWSTFKEAIANKIGMSSFSVGWAFSLAIFFLGMSAAFAGKMVEKNIKRSSLISCICFVLGVVLTGVFINYTTGVTALIGIYMSYGVLMGIGLGVGYITPVKTLMLWFKDKKGLATGISIMGFGLAKAIFTPIMEKLQGSYGISNMFYLLGIIFFFMMYISHLLLKKPNGHKEEDETKNSFNVLSMFKNKTFLGIWLMFFINIHCGLALITYEKQIINATFLKSMLLPVMISLVPSLTAVFNALGRIGYSTISDKLKDRNTIYKIIFTSSIIVTLISLISSSISNGYKSIIFGIMTIILLVVINAGYGGGFSTLPALLSSRFGMKKISKIHGLSLTAWAIAGLTGNNMSELILKLTDYKYEDILIFTCLLYVLAFFISKNMIKKGIDFEN